MAQILPLTNPSTSAGGRSAHWQSLGSLVKKPRDRSLIPQYQFNRTKQHTVLEIQSHAYPADIPSRFACHLHAPWSPVCPRGLAEFAIYGHPGLLSQRQVRYDKIIPRFSPFESVHKQVERFALNIECHEFDELHSLQLPINPGDTRQPLSGGLIYPCALPPVQHISHRISSQKCQCSRCFSGNISHVTQKAHQSRVILFFDLTLAFHLPRRIVSCTFGLCGMYKFMLSCNSSVVGRLDPHIMAHILNIHCGLPSPSPAFESSLASGYSRCRCVCVRGSAP